MTTFYDAHVICCNDSVEYVLLGSEEAAEVKLEQLAKEYFDKCGGGNHWPPRTFQPRPMNSYEVYRQQIRWHIKTVQGEDPHGG